MKYFVVKFSINPYSTDAADIVAALAGEAGFESFEQTSDGLVGYVQQTLFDGGQLRLMLDNCPLPGVEIAYTIAEADDCDWNEQWEQQGFEPITVAGKLVIHDGRHGEVAAMNAVTAIEIDARQAFGTGNHETTRMMCAALMELAPAGKRVLDCGTGTGILAITALKLGAREAIGYDIDEWSVENARHNAVINSVDHSFKSLLGDSSVLNQVSGTFDLVTANINRNILLADLPAFVSKMASGAALVLSGFYLADVPLLTEQATSSGLILSRQQTDNDWVCLVFVKAPTNDIR